MTQDIKTLELARVYENQGYYKDAHEIYLFLNEQGTTPEIQAGLNRMEKKMENEKQEIYPEKKIAALFEKWLMLMVLKQRLGNFLKIKSRLT